MHLISADFANRKYSSVISPLYPVRRSSAEMDLTWYVIANPISSGSSSLTGMVCLGLLRGWGSTAKAVAIPVSRFDVRIRSSPS